MNGRAMQKVPVTLIIGALGAGKTTLVKRIAASARAWQVGVVVNEFAAMGIDADLIGDAPAGIVQIDDGCVCCAGIDALGEAFGLLFRGADRLDRIVVEASGLADPAPVAARLLADHRLAPVVTLDCIVSVVDASQSYAAEAPDKLALADVILVNKADLAVEADLLRQEAGIRGINAHAQIVRTRYCGVELELLARSGQVPRPVNRYHAVDASVVAVSLQHPGELRSEAFLDWAGSLASQQPGLLRAKGIVAFREHAERFVFQQVAKTVDGGFEHPWRRDEERTSRLVLIGRNLDGGRLAAGFAACAA